MAAVKRWRASATASPPGSWTSCAALISSTMASASQDRLTPNLVAREHDVVIEHSQYLHEPIVP